MDLSQASYMDLKERKEKYRGLPDLTTYKGGPGSRSNSVAQLPTSQTPQIAAAYYG